MPSDIKDKIKIFRFFIIGILCLFIFIIFSLSFFYLAGIERGAVSRNIPGSVKNPIKTAYAGLKNAVIKIEDLPYIIYRFKPSSLPVYNLTIDQKDWNFLNKNLPDPDNWREIYYDEKYDGYKPAKFTFNGKTYDVKVRYRGGMPDHWADTKKSWRVKFPADNLFLGQRAINLIIPSGRHFYIDALNNYRAGKLGLAVPKSDYVQFYINGQNYGPYYKLEQWGKEMLEKDELAGDANQYSEKGPGEEVFKDIFAWQKVGADALSLYDNYAEAGQFISLLDLKTTSDEEFWKKIEGFMDMDTYYKWQVQAALAGSIHQNFGHNVQWYFDNAIGKFKPLSDDVSRDDIEGRIIPMNNEQYSIDFINMNPVNTRILKNPKFLYERNKILWDYLKDDENLEDDLKFFDDLYDKTKIAIYNDSIKPYSNAWFKSYAAYMRKLTVNNFKYLKNLFKISDASYKVSGGKSLPVAIDLQIKNFTPVYIKNMELSTSGNTGLKWNVYYDKNKNSLVDTNDAIMGSLAYDKIAKKYLFKPVGRVDFHTNREWIVNKWSRLQEKDLLTTNYRLLLVPDQSEATGKLEIKLTINNSITEETL